MLTFRPLTEQEIEVKVKQVRQNGVVCLLYKNARTDMDLLDETVGPENWSNDYREVKGNLYAGISINFGNGEWIEKWDCGIESRADGEGNEKKGEASDAFKRAGFRWGIGRALYTSPFIWVPSEKCNIRESEFGGKKKYSCYDSFSVEKIKYSEDGKRIIALAIHNDTNGKRAFVWQQT